MYVPSLNMEYKRKYSDISLNYLEAILALRG